MSRPIWMIANEIYRDWKNVNYAALPYLEAMTDIVNIEDYYGVDPASSVVAYFLANAGSWRGEKAREIKKELNARLDAYFDARGV